MGGLVRCKGVTCHSECGKGLPCQSGRHVRLRASGLEKVMHAWGGEVHVLGVVWELKMPMGIVWVMDVPLVDDTWCQGG